MQNLKKSSAKNNVLLQIKNISVNYGGVHALEKVNIHFAAGEIVALMGTNGAGKSTILKSIFGLAPISSGSIAWAGKKYEPVSHEVVAMGISFVPQGRRVFSTLTVRENLEMGGFVIRDRSELGARIEEVLDIFPVLRAKLNDPSGSLSGGQQQMLALARGLMSRPRLLLLDEPSLGLAPKLVREVFTKIREINERHGTTIVVVEHNLKSLLAIVDRAYVMDKGRIITEDKPSKIIASGILEKVFLGKIENVPVKK